MRSFRLGEIFCGPGGIALGAKNASLLAEKIGLSITHTWAVDFDPDSCMTYAHNIVPTEKDKVICADVRHLDISRLQPIDAFAFGFPCNDFSLVGEKKGINGQFGSLYSYGVKILDRFQPEWFIAENVGGLRSANQGSAFEKIMQDLQDVGYNLVPHLYNFADYGVPQARHRIIIVGIRKDLGLEFKVPCPTTPKPITVRQALLENPIPSSAPNQEVTKQSSTVVERLKYIKAGENAWSANIPPELRLNVKGATMSQIYRRLELDKPAYTITGSGGGGTHVYHWEENRALTNRERARLQTFPDDFKFYGSKESVRRQIGMAVPPTGAKVVIEAILKTFANISYFSVPAKWQDQLRPQASQLKLLENSIRYG
jgi:DNA (cytosine-5)-methyltransferase 1